MASPKKSDVVAALHTGLATAVQRFETWTGGCSLSDFGAENVLTVSCAETLWAVAEPAGCTLSLESQFQDVCATANCHSPGPGRPTTSRAKLKRKPTGRVDLVLWNARERPHVAIELKRAAGKAGLEHDAERLIDFLSELGAAKGGSLRYGLLGAIFKAKAGDDSEAVAVRAATRVKMLAALARRRKVDFAPHGPLRVERNYEGAPAATYVFEFKRRRSKTVP